MLRHGRLLSTAVVVDPLELITVPWKVPPELPDRLEEKLNSLFKERPLSKVVGDYDKCKQDFGTPGAVYGSPEALAYTGYVCCNK